MLYLFDHSTSLYSATPIRCNLDIRTRARSLGLSNQMFKEPLLRSQAVLNDADVSWYEMVEVLHFTLLLGLEICIAFRK